MAWSRRTLTVACLSIIPSLPHNLDTSWVPGKETEKAVAVYQRQ